MAVPFFAAAWSAPRMVYEAWSTRTAATGSRSVGGGNVLAGVIRPSNDSSVRRALGLSPAGRLPGPRPCVERLTLRIIGGPPGLGDSSAFVLTPGIRPFAPLPAQVRRGE